MTALVPATPAHAEPLALIHGRSFPPGEGWGPDAMALQLGLPGTFGWLAAAGGLVLARATLDEAEILTLAVDPSARRRGLGRALLAAAMRTAAQRGAGRMFLEVAEANQPARRLYAAASFAAVGRRTAYYRGGGDALVLRAALALADPE